MRLKLTTSAGTLLAEHSDGNAIQIGFAGRNTSESVLGVTIVTGSQSPLTSTAVIVEVFKWLESAYPALVVYEVKLNV